MVFRIEKPNILNLIEKKKSALNISNAQISSFPRSRNAAAQVNS